MILVENGLAISYIQILSFNILNNLYIFIFSYLLNHKTPHACEYSRINPFDPYCPSRCIFKIILLVLHSSMTDFSGGMPTS